MYWHWTVESADNSCAITNIVSELLAMDGCIAIAPIKWCKETMLGAGSIETDDDGLAVLIVRAAEKAGVELIRVTDE